MKPVTECLSRVGAVIGNLNDRLSKHDSRSGATRRWRIIDRISSVLYTLPDRTRR